MKKLFIALAATIVLVFTMAFAISAETIEVVDDGTNLELGDCIIEGLEKEIPAPTRGFTFSLDTEAKTAKITAWANYADKELGKTLCLPSTVTYDGNVYTVTLFDRVVNNTNNGNGQTNKGNYYLENIFIPDTVTAIPNNAFDTCRALKNVYVGKNVETMGQRAFIYAGFTGEAYFVDDGDGNLVRSETVGMPVGNIENFIWTTQKIRTIPTYCFHHMDFDEEATILFPFDKITTFESDAMSSNGNAFQNGHYNNAGFNMEVFDIRNATTVSSSAFTNIKISASTFLLNADQVNALSPQKLRGTGANQPNVENYFVIYGGETAETAKTLSAGIWVINAHYWSATVHMNIAIKGYVNAYDGTDGLENQNGYGKDFIDYFFESEQAFAHYINSVKTTTNASTTLARYAKNTKGYFNACQGNGTIKAYNLQYTPAQEGAEAVVTIVDSTVVPAIPKWDKIMGDDCTASNVCMCCDYVFVKGLEHVIGETQSYPNGYIHAGVKVVGCTRCLKGEETPISPLFETYGYSKDTKSVAIVHKVKVNKTAISEYEAYLTSKNGESITIEYGVLASIAREDDEETSFVGGMPLTSNGEIAEGYNGVVGKMTGTSFTILEIKICGITDYTAGLNCNAYVIVDGNITYINGNETSDKALTVTYDSLPNE